MEGGRGGWRGCQREDGASVTGTDQSPRGEANEAGCGLLKG